MADFGAIIRKMREQHSISQRDLAERIGIDFTYISKFENGHQDPPSEDVIIKMAEVFGVNKYDLIICAGKTPTDFAWVIKVDEDVQRLLQEKVAHYQSIMNQKESES